MNSSEAASRAGTQYTEPNKRPSIEPATRLLGNNTLSTPITHRPAATTLGCVLLSFRIVFACVWLALVIMIWPEIQAELGETAESLQPVLILLWVLTGGFVLVLSAVIWLIWRGSNIARILSMSVLTVSVVSSGIAHFALGEQITLSTTLVTLSLDILILLALSSRESRAWSQR